MAARTLAARMHRPSYGLLGRLLSVFDLRASRVRLGQLDSHMLRDIGISPEQAAQEAERPFWDAPQGWRR